MWSDGAGGVGPNTVLTVTAAMGIAFEKGWQDKRGIQGDLRGGPAGAPAVAAPVRESFGARELLGERGREQEFLGACPDCGSQLTFAEGCAKCHVCGYSECG